MNFNEFYLSRKLISAKINLRKVLDMFMLLIKILSGNLLKLWTHDQQANSEEFFASHELIRLVEILFNQTILCLDYKKSSFCFVKFKENRRFNQQAQRCQISFLNFLVSFQNFWFALKVLFWFPSKILGFLLTFLWKFPFRIFYFAFLLPKFIFGLPSKIYSLASFQNFWFPS